MTCCNIELIRNLKWKLSQLDMQKYVDESISKNGRICFFEVLIAIDYDNDTSYYEEFIELDPCEMCIQQALKPHMEKYQRIDITPLPIYVFSSYEKMGVRYFDNDLHMSNEEVGKCVVKYSKSGFTVNNYRALGNKKIFKFSGDMELYSNIIDDEVMVSEIKIIPSIKFRVHVKRDQLKTSKKITMSNVPKLSSITADVDGSHVCIVSKDSIIIEEDGSLVSHKLEEFETLALVFRKKITYELVSISYQNPSSC